MDQWSTFLRGVEDLNAKYSSIEIDGDLEELVFSFWAYMEIEKSLGMREEWDVPAHLIPFYGDWHDLICLDSTSGRVVCLNDDRERVMEWEDSSAFLKALSEEEVETDEGPEPVAIWLDPSLD